MSYGNSAVTDEITLNRNIMNNLSINEKINIKSHYSKKANIINLLKCNYESALINKHIFGNTWHKPTLRNK